MHKGPSIQSNVTHIEGVEIAYRAPQYRAMLLILEVSKVYIGRSIQSNVEGAEHSSIYNIRAIMLCMLKVSKEAQNDLTHLCPYNVY